MVKVTVPTSAEIAKKWGDEAPKRSTYYEANTPGASAKWETDTAAAAGNFTAAIQAPDIAKRFKGGVKGKAEKFARKVTAVGVGRYGPGITAAVADMQKGMDPVVADIASIEIDARKPRGDPGNLSGRQAKMSNGLNAKRLARLAAAGA
jgi:hypothetical protein